VIKIAQNETSFATAVPEVKSAGLMAMPRREHKATTPAPGAESARKAKKGANTKAGSEAWEEF
jgi:hypothetical protein